MSELKFSPIDEIIADLKAGKLVIVADDPGRENEADLVGAASLISPESIAFMANYGRGLICTPIIPERAKALDLSPMTPKNREAHKTAFTGTRASGGTALQRRCTDASESARTQERSTSPSPIGLFHATLCVLCP